MKIYANLYNTPMKPSQVQPYLQEMFNVQKHDPNLQDQLRSENLDLYDTIFDLQEQVTTMEKELEELKEENEGL